MIHGKLFRWKLVAAVMTNAGSSLALPPLAGADLTRLLALAPNLFFADFYEKRSRIHGARSGEKITNTTV
jgi:hypothetical protein